MDAVEEVKSRLSIEDVVADYVQLKRAGRNLKGLSPWTNEKTASLMVSPEKQIWHDFSSGKGGNIYSFVMDMEGLDFRGALELLARKAGVDLEQYGPKRSSSSGSDKERLYEANELAARFYQLQLKKSKTALDYVLKKRAFTKQVAVDFRLGYATNNSNSLCALLKAKGFSDAELTRAGLATKSGQTRDMFRGRIMIPLADQQGRTIGFTGRLLDDEQSGPKYLNTPATPIYDKSRHIFGLHLAKEAIRKLNYAIMVEGNLDVIASHQAGVANTVASAGTAMTEYHLKILSRFTPDIRLAFDQDSAGIAATERAIPLAEKTNVHLSIINLGDAKDPDELIQKNLSTWSSTVEQKQDVLDWLITQHQKHADLNTYAGREQFKRAVLVALKKLTSTGEQQRYATKVAKLLGYSAEAVMDEIKQLNSPSEQLLRSKKSQTGDQTSSTKELEQNKLQDHLLAIAINQPDIAKNISVLAPVMLEYEPAKKLLELVQNGQYFSTTTGKDLLPGLDDYVKILTLQYEELYQDLELIELQYEATRLQVRLIEMYVKKQKIPISESLRGANETDAELLLQKAKDLDDLLKLPKENN